MVCKPSLPSRSNCSKSPSDGVVNPGGEGNLLNKTPKVDELRYVIDREVIHEEVRDPFEISESIVNLYVLASGGLKEGRRNNFRGEVVKPRRAPE